jgi:glycerol kinase
MQFQADLLGVPVLRPRHVETTAAGAAYLAGLAVGYWTDQADITRNWQVDTRFTPAADRAAMNAKRRGWDRALERAKGWIEPA